MKVAKKRRDGGQDKMVSLVLPIVCSYRHCERKAILERNHAVLVCSTTPCVELQRTRRARVLAKKWAIRESSPMQATGVML